MSKKMWSGIVLSAALFAGSTASAGSGDTWNVSVSPFGAAVGVLNIGVDYAVTPEWAVGPFIAYVNAEYPKSGSLTEDITVSGTSVGVRGVWFQNGVFTDGWYGSPAVVSSSVEAESKDASGKLQADGHGTAARATVGYGWFWDSFNMMLGAGGNIALGDSKITIRDSNGSDVEETAIYSAAMVEFNLGWSF